MKNKIKYKSNNNIVYSCKYHIVWCPKYRRKVLVDDVERRLKEIIKEVAEELLDTIKQYIENQQSSQRPKAKQKWERYVRSLQI
jgi:REP element-mobilizing transposase RayT